MLNNHEQPDVSRGLSHFYLDSDLRPLRPEIPPGDLPVRSVNLGLRCREALLEQIEELDGPPERYMASG